MSREHHEREELARRALATTRWKWLPGMLGLVGQDRELFRIHKTVPPSWFIQPDARPVLSDAATRGCLLHLVRGAFPDCSTCKDGPGWFVIDRDGIEVCGPCPTESGALVEALEVADRGRDDD